MHAVNKVQCERRPILLQECSSNKVQHPNLDAKRRGGKADDNTQQVTQHFRALPKHIGPLQY